MGEVIRSLVVVGVVVFAVFMLLESFSRVQQSTKKVKPVTEALEHDSGGEWKHYLLFLLLIPLLLPVLSPILFGRAKEQEPGEDEVKVKKVRFKDEVEVKEFQKRNEDDDFNELLSEGIEEVDDNDLLTEYEDSILTKHVRSGIIDSPIMSDFIKNALKENDLERIFLYYSDSDLLDLPKEVISNIPTLIDHFKGALSELSEGEQNALREAKNAGRQKRSEVVKTLVEKRFGPFDSSKQNEDLGKSLGMKKEGERWSEEQLARMNTMRNYFKHFFIRKRIGEFEGEPEFKPQGEHVVYD